MPGRTTSRLTRTKIDPLEVVESVADPKAGAVALFLGIVRDNSEAGRVEKIDYEAYEPMAEKALLQAEREVVRGWPASRKVKVVHRLGRLSVGDVSVAVAVSSPHRAQAFEACRQAVERIKHDAPIWKREQLANGREVWVEGVPIGSGPATRGARPKGRRLKRRVRGLPSRESR